MIYVVIHLVYDSRKGYVFLRNGDDEKLNFDEGSVTNVSDTIISYQ